MKIVLEINVDEIAWRNRDKRVAGPFATPISGQGIADTLADAILGRMEGIPNAVYARVVEDEHHVVVLPTDVTATTLPAGMKQVDAVRELEARLAAMGKRLEELESWAARACGDYAFDSGASIAIRLG